MEEKFAIHPHHDIELGFKRDLLRYYLTFPEQGMNEETGVILFIDGYGMRPNSEYDSQKLRPYLASKYNCLTVGVHYWGVDLKGGDYADHIIKPGKYFFQALQQIYNIPIEQCMDEGQFRIDILADILQSRNIIELDPRANIITCGKENAYQSFGFLPAIDYLVVLGDVLKRFPVTKRKIVAFGTSYGGYIALLLGKFAPHTFSVIIDNSGFVKTDMHEIIDNSVKFIMGYMTINNVNFSMVSNNPWTILDEYSPFYFSEAHRRIRSLLEDAHFTHTATKYFSFHSTEDYLIPIREKDLFVEKMKKYASVVYERITAQNINKNIFKNIEHSLGASMRGLFDHVAENANLLKEDSVTDFDRRTQKIFLCMDKKYQFSFYEDNSLSVELQSVGNQPVACREAS